MLQWLNHTSQAGSKTHSNLMWKTTKRRLKEYARLGRHKSCWQQMSQCETCLSVALFAGDLDFDEAFWWAPWFCKAWALAVQRAGGLHTCPHRDRWMNAVNQAQVEEFRHKRAFWRGWRACLAGKAKLWNDPIRPNMIQIRKPNAKAPVADRVIYPGKDLQDHQVQPSTWLTKSHH